MVLAGGRGGDDHAPAASRAGDIHARDPVKPGTEAAVGGHGVPLRGRGYAATDRWQRLIAYNAGCHLGWHLGAQRTRLLLAASYTTITQRTYTLAWDRFARYCHQAGLRALPAHYTTVTTYFGDIHLPGKVSARSLGAYLAPVSTVHQLAGYPSPTSHPRFPRLRKGFLYLDASTRGGLTAYCGPLPADVVLAALQFAREHQGVAYFRVGAGWHWRFSCLIDLGQPQLYGPWTWRSQPKVSAFVYRGISLPPGRAPSSRI